MSCLIIVATTEERSSDLWDYTNKWKHVEFELGKNRVWRFMNFQDDEAKFVIFCHEIYKIKGDDNKYDTIKIAKKTISDIKKICLNYDILDSYMAIHDKAFEPISFQETFSDSTVKKFTHGFDIGKIIKQFVINPSTETFKSVRNAISGEGEPDLGDCLSLLKHDIAPLLDPLKNDLQTLMEISKAERDDCLQDMRKSYSTLGKKPFETLLKQLHNGISGPCANITDDALVKCPEAVNNGRKSKWCIKDIIEELDLSLDEVEKLKKQAGLTENWELNADADLVKFIRELDGSWGIWDNQNLDDTQKKQEIKRKISVAIKKLDFSQWLVDLDEILGKLRDEAKQKLKPSQVYKK